MVYKHFLTWETTVQFEPKTIIALIIFIKSYGQVQLKTAVFHIIFKNYKWITCHNLLKYNIEFILEKTSIAVR